LVVLLDGKEFLSLRGFSQVFFNRFFIEFCNQSGMGTGTKNHNELFNTAFWMPFFALWLTVTKKEK
jgi:hypothetical protein